MDWDLDANLDHIPCFRHMLAVDRNQNLANIPLNLALVQETSLALLIVIERKHQYHRLVRSFDMLFACLSCVYSKWLYFKYLRHLVGHPLNMVMHRLLFSLHTSWPLLELCQCFSCSEYVYYQTNLTLVTPIGMKIVLVVNDLLSLAIRSTKTFEMKRKTSLLTNGNDFFVVSLKMNSNTIEVNKKNKQKEQAKSLFEWLICRIRK